MPQDKAESSIVYLPLSFCLGKKGGEDPWSSLVIRSSIVSKLQASERPCVKSKVEKEKKSIWHDLCLPHAPAPLLHTQERTPTQTCTRYTCMHTHDGNHLGGVDLAIQLLNAGCDFLLLCPLPFASLCQLPVSALAAEPTLERKFMGHGLCPLTAVALRPTIMLGWEVVGAPWLSQLDPWRPSLALCNLIFLWILLLSLFICRGLQNLRFL